ncbi:Imm74 family immunity protein [Massilia sp. CT11-137]|uniref:Imm74 family immunity protein n=1 Tax=Massilia sp. CT11-137 TaxID=3393901 RepID=UPI0039A5D9B0
MNFEVIHVSRGDIRLKCGDKHVRVLGEALIASASTEPSYIIYLDSLYNWEVPSDVALTETEKNDVVSTIRKHFQDCGSVVEFE